jgi:phosphomevalonate decarboxylase
MKATASAHPVQELVKLPGSKDNPRGVHLRDAISVCTAPLKTQTTVEFGDFGEDSASAEGIEFRDAELAMLTDFIDTFRVEAKSSSRFRMLSVSNFPRGVGISTMPSMLASLALASCNALDLTLGPEDISRMVMRFSPLAAMSLTGGFSRLRTGAGESSGASQIASESLQMGMFLTLTPQNEPILGGGPRAHLMVQTGIAENPILTEEMELAIREGDVGKVCMLAERDTLVLHGVTLTGTGEEAAWGPETLRIIHAIRTMREDGLPAFFSSPRGGPLHINTLPERVDDVNDRIMGLELEYWKCGVGREAEIAKEHLF